MTNDTEELLAADQETLVEHVERSLTAWTEVAPRFEPALRSIFGDPPEDLIQWLLKSHDMGKATSLWQHRIRNNGRPPPHAAIGAAFLWINVPWQDHTARNAAAFAIAIHHVDRGLVGSNIDDPATQAVMSGVAHENGQIRWHQSAHYVLQQFSLPSDGFNRLNLEALEQMARALRTWSRGGAYAHMHRNRLLASVLHHCLKICDLRAATLRPPDHRDGPQPPAWVRKIVHGGLLP